MTILHALLLSVIEGLTEYLPISSTGHMILAAKLFNIPQTEFTKSFEIFIQLGAILAIIVMFGKRFIKSRDIWLRVAAAFIPTAIIGFVLYKLIKLFLLGNSLITVATLLVGGIVMILLEKMYKEKPAHSGEIEHLTISQAIVIGLIQALSIVPGVSRSAASILGGMYLGMNREAAVEFSFLLAVPTLMAATGLDLIKSHLSYSSTELMLLAVGFIGAFLTALLTIKFLLGYVRNHTFIPFGIYRIIIALLFFLSIR